MDKVMIDPDSCKMCGSCILSCPMGILIEGSKLARTSKPETCYYCGHCKAVCPEDAIHFPVLPDEDFEPALPDEESHQADRLLQRFRSRRTIRNFRSDAVEREKIEKIISAGRYAPTGNNRQGVEYLVINSSEALAELKGHGIKALSDLSNEVDRLTAMAGEDQNALLRFIPAFKSKVDAARKGQDLLFYNAPALILCHIDPSVSPFAVCDVSLAAMQMILMAEALGLGTCFNGALIRAMEHSAELRATLSIPAEHEIPLCFMVGYPSIKYLRTVYRKPAQVAWI